MKLDQILREHAEVSPQSKKKPKQKNPAAVALGRRSGQARARSLSRRERQAIARMPIKFGGTARSRDDRRHLRAENHMAPRWGHGADRDNAERVIHRTGWGWRRPDRCRRCVGVPRRILDRDLEAEAQRPVRL